MSTFDVLDPDLDLSRSYFLEASAGTGKTFAIEQIVARRVKDPDGPSLEEILVVTFTRAATLELKMRIRRTLGPSFPFDEAKIFTIHSFCFHTLQENALETGLSLEQIEESGATEALKRCIKDYLRTELSEELISPKQLEKLLRRHQNQIDLLVGRLLSVTSKRLPIACGRPFNEIYEALQEAIATLPPSEDLLVEARHFNKMCDRQKNVKPEIQEGLIRSQALLAGERCDPVDLPLLLMSLENRKKGAPPPSSFILALQEGVIPLLQELSDAFRIFATVAEGARKQIEQYIEKEELFFFEDLLRLMAKEVENPTFAQRIRSQYKAVLIDEFQDTDPLQWKIFSTLFLDEAYEGTLYLVGDPKQSIYRFRNADLYTYLEAKKTLGERAYATLACNYRSHPDLVAALNTLCGSVPDFFPLPRIEQSLPCPPVRAGREGGGVFQDEKGRIHICEGENEAALFAFIVDEARRLHREEKIAYREMAVLVKDRFQAARFTAFCPLPTAMQKSRSLLESDAYSTLIDLIAAVLNPRDRNRALRVLGGPLFALPLATIGEEESLRFYHYHHLLDTRGILPLFQEVVQQAQLSDELLYQDLLQLVELLAEAHLPTDGLLPYLLQLSQEDPEEERLKARGVTDAEAIQVMTIHVSKGLEFAVVFPIGLSISPVKKRTFVLSHEQEALVEKDRLAEQEEEAEKRRLLYVAITRARERLYLPIVAGSHAPLNTFLEEADTTCASRELYRDSKERQSKRRYTLTFPEKRPLYLEPITIHSFTSLADPYEPEERQTPSEDPLPAGAAIGTLLHTLLEKLPFEQAFRAETLLPLVAPLLQNTPLEPWQERIAQMLHNTFHTPLPAPDAPFCLAQVDPKKLLKELEFLYPIHNPEGYVKGFIDLVFEFGGKSYIIDWKSNDLGGDYSPKRLQEAMETHQYTVQAQIYEAALTRYLATCPNAAPYGGAFYLFLRAPHNQGIHYVPNR